MQVSVGLVIISIISLNAWIYQVPYTAHFNSDWCYYCAILPLILLKYAAYINAGTRMHVTYNSLATCRTQTLVSIDSEVISQLALAEECMSPMLSASGIFTPSIASIGEYYL